MITYLVQHYRQLTGLLALTFLAGFQLSAQKDSSGRKGGYVKGGLSFIIAGAKSSDNLTFFPALTISPGWRFVQTKEFSLSLEAPISAGISINDDNVNLGIELPASVNINFGHGASYHSTAGFGWSIGIGKAYHFSYNEYVRYDDIERDKLSLWGTLLQTSFYFGSKKRGSGGGGGCIRFHWISNFSTNPVRKDVIGIGLMALID